MALTLAQAKVGMADHIDQQVIDTFQRGSALLDALTFDNSVSPGTGGSTLIYGYTQLLTPTTAAGRALNNEYTPGEALRTVKTTPLKIFGGSFQVDRVLEGTAAQSEIAFQLEEKIKAVRNKLHYDIINGVATKTGGKASAADGTSFDGLATLLTDADTAFTSAADLSTYALTKTNAGPLIEEIQTMIAAMAEKPDALLVNSTLKTKLCTAAREAGYYTHAEDAFGASVDKFDGIPIIDMGGYYNGTKLVDVIATDATTKKTDLYAVKFGLNALHACSPQGGKIINTYLPNLEAPGAVKTGEVEIVMGLALKNTKMAGVLKGIKVATTA